MIGYRTNAPIPFYDVTSEDSLWCNAASGSGIILDFGEPPGSNHSVFDRITRSRIASLGPWDVIWMMPYG